MPVVRKPFGRLQDGQDVNSILLTDAHRRLSVEILEYGATIRAINVLDRKGDMVNVVLSYPTLDDYEEAKAYLGSTIGRCAGRTSGRQHRTLRLSCNEDTNHLHGGSMGVSYSLWQFAGVDDGESPSVRLRKHLPAGEDGYPGNLTVEVAFSLIGDRSLHVLMQAYSDADTPLNMTLHPYFNLNGDPTSTVDNHTLCIDSAAILELDTSRLPTGDLIQVADTPFDFRMPHPIGTFLDHEHPQLRIAEGYDHYYILNDGTVAADVFSPSSLLGLRINTNQRGLQFYSGNHLGTSTTLPFRPRSGFCLEPHAFPNAIHEPRFPDIVLRAGDLYRHETTYAFYTNDSAQIHTEKAY